MLLAYVDESYDRDFYYIAAAIAPQTAWSSLKQAFDDIRRRTAIEHGTPADIELHGHELMGGKGDWSPLRGKHREAAGIYQAALSAAQQAEVKYVFRGLDIGRLNARYRYPEQPHALVFSHLLERIDDYASGFAGNEKVLVTADQIATQADHQRQFEGYQLAGTRGYRSSRLSNIANPITFASSKRTEGLQAVDLAAYLHRRRSARSESNVRAQRSMDRLSSIIKTGTVHEKTWTP
jgi:hypothetical protein